MLDVILPIATSLTLAASTPSHCTRQAPILNFKTKIEKTEYIKGKTSEEITRAYALGNPDLGDEAVVRGTASPQINISYSVKPKIREIADGHLCGYAQYVDILLTASPIIHLASEYQFGSCEYKEVINHENEHVEITKDLIKEYKRTVKRDLTQRIREVSGHKPGPANSDNEVEQYIRQASAIVIGQVEGELRREHAIRQSKIDTPEEYAKIQSRCISWNR